MLKKVDIYAFYVTLLFKLNVKWMFRVKRKYLNIH